MLVDYSSSSDSTQDSDRELDPPVTKRIKLPSATELLNIGGSRKSSDAPEDDPELHQGRIRSFAHERGNWASYCYFKLTTGGLIEELRTAIQNCCQDEGMDVQFCPIEEVHLSLTKTFVLQHHWIELFRKSVVESLSSLCSRKGHSIRYDSIKVYENEDNTRTFIALGVCTEDYHFIDQVVRKLDECLDEFKLPPFYVPADYHASFMWCLGSHKERMTKLLEKFNKTFRDLQELYKHSSNDELETVCDPVNCKIGHTLYKIPIVVDR